MSTAATASNAESGSGSLPPPPMMPGAFPFVGHALELRNPVEFVQRGYDKFGGVFSIKLPTFPMCAVMIGPKPHEKFFRLRDNDMSMRKIYRLMTPIFGKGMAYDAEPEIMKEQLGFFHVALRETRLRTYAQGFVEEAEDYFNRWDDAGVVDMYEVGNELTIYTSSRSLLGKQFRDELSDEFAQLYFEMEDGLKPLAFFAPNAPIPAFIKRDRARKRMQQLVAKIIRQRRERGLGDEDFLDTLLEAKYSDGRPLTEAEITGLLMAIMFAGHHTSGVTFAWTGILLQQNPHWIPELLAEQDAILGDRTEITLEDLRAMHKLEWTVKEVLRMYPPIIMMFRELLKGIDYGGYHVPKGSLVMTCPSVAHRLPEVFTDPNKFDPTRFSPERAEDKKFPMGMISFGAGRHRCMGIVFAQLQLRAIWSHLLRNFEFELIEPKYEPDYTRALVGPRKPCRLRYRRKQPRTSVPAAE